MKIWLKDPKTGKHSVTLSLLVSGFSVMITKLAVSGLTLGIGEMSMTFEPFSGSDFAAAMAALGGIYGWRKMQEHKADNSDPDERAM